MQRVSSETHQVSTLSSALVRPHEATTAVKMETKVRDPAWEMERLRQETIAAAKEEGYRMGMQAAEVAIAEAQAAAELAVQDRHRARTEELSARIAEIRILLEGIPQALGDHQQRLQAALVEISFAATLRILGELHLDTELVARLCDGVLREYRQRPATLHVAPDDYAVLEPMIESADLRIESDAMQKRGQLRLESTNGAYEAGLDTRLENMLQAFLAGLTRREG